MNKRILIHIIKKILNKCGVIEYSINSWKKYSKYIKIHPSVIVAPSSSVKIYNPPDPPEICLEIGEGSHIFSKFSLFLPNSRIKIGKNSQLGNSHFICLDRIEVGDDVLMAWGCTIMDNDSHALEWEYRKNDVGQCYKDYLEDSSNIIRNKDWSHVKSGPIVIGNKSWIGYNVSILKNVSIGEESVIGACSVVSKSIPDKSKRIQK
jgi:galactoside O-acetyltransferase